MWKYRKKPVVIEAIQNTQELRDALASNNATILPIWLMNGLDSKIIRPSDMFPHLFYIDSKEGAVRCPNNNWIIRGIQGELYACDPVIFEATYDKVKE